VTPARWAVLDRVIEAVLALSPTGIVRVGIDGVDGAGKSTLADELRDRLASSGRPVIRATVDGFRTLEVAGRVLLGLEPRGLF